MVHLAQLLFIPLAGAACPADGTILRADLRMAQQAWSGSAWEAFDATMAAVMADLGCLVEPLPAEQAAAVHRLFALSGARTDDEDLAVAAYRALLVVEPDFESGLTLAPEGSLLRTAWERAQDAGPGADLAVPARGWLVDGKPVPNVLPADRAAVVQLALADGSWRSWYLDGGAFPEELAELTAPLEPVAAPAPEQVVDAGQRVIPITIPGLATLRERCEPPSRPLLVYGAAFGLAGIGSIAVGEAFENRMMRTDRERTAANLYRAGLATSFTGLAFTLTGAGFMGGAAVQACRPGWGAP